MKKWLFHPFTYIAGLQALAIGWLIMIVTAVICYYSNVHFDGVLDMHPTNEKYPLIIFLLEQLIDWGALVLVFFPAGRIFSQSAIRLVDVAGTLGLARWPLIFPALFGFCIHMPSMKNIRMEDAAKLITPGVIGFGLLSVIFTVWMVALLYQAFSISTNLKGGKATGIFIGGLVLAELISKFILHLL